MGTRLYVGNLPFSADQSAVQTLFEQNDRSVTEVKLITDRETGQPRCFGFVEMGSTEDADKAILVYTDLVTRKPWECTEEHVNALRTAGFDDRGIYDITAICGFFAFINRIADALGVALEPSLEEQYGKQFGDPLPAARDGEATFSDEPHAQ